MQPGPGTPLNIQRSTFAKLMIFVGVVGGVTYAVYQIFDYNTALIVFFLILLNTYWFYRIRLRNKMADKLGIGNKEEGQQSEYSPPNQYKAPTNSSTPVEAQQQRWDEMEEQYQTCPECDARVISGLTYCEECGTSL